MDVIAYFDIIIAYFNTFLVINIRALVIRNYIF